MPTQYVNLTPELDGFVKGQVASCSYNNASEVHRAALTALARDEEERQLRLDDLRENLAKGVNELEAGRFASIGDEADHESYFSGLRAEAVKQASAK